MKKVLLTSSMLALMAGAAHAEVTIGGDTRLGVTYNEGNTGRKTDIEQRTNFNIDGSTSTDGGLTVGARVRIRSNETDVSGSPQTDNTSGASVYVASDSFRLTVGNVADALDSLPNLYDGAVGLTGLGFLSAVTSGAAGFQSNNSGQDGVRLDASFGGADLAVAFTDSDNSITTDDAISASIAYTFGDWVVAVGHEDTNGVGVTTATLGGSFGNFGIDAVVSDNNGTTAMSLSANTSLDSGLGLSAFAADNGGANTAFGIGFTYGLGGATLAGGVVSDFNQNMRADFGIRAKF